MNRLVLSLVAGAGALGIAACGSATAGTTAPTTSPSASPGRGARLGNAAAGQLVQIKAQTLILSNANGDTTVTYTSSTPISEASTAALADITTGVCMTAAGTRDSSGLITAQAVTVRNATNGSCAGTGIFGPTGGPNNGGVTRTPDPNRTPPPQAANLGRASGLVTAVSGTSVTLQEQSGSSVTLTVPTTVRVSRIDAVTPSALQTGQCVAAVGSKNSSGVVAARSLTIVPAGPNGCFTGGAGGGGGFFFGGGGRGFPGGGGGG